MLNNQKDRKKAKIDLIFEGYYFILHNLKLKAKKNRETYVLFEYIKATSISRLPLYVISAYVIRLSHISLNVGTG